MLLPVQFREGVGLTDATGAVVLTGLFTLGGVVVTSIAAGVGAAVRRRWSVDDDERARRESDRRELRQLRREAYAELLAAFNHEANSYALFAAKIEAGEARKITELSERGERARYIHENVPELEKLDALVWKAAVVASKEVYELIMAMDTELMDLFRRVASGEGANPSLFFNLRKELSEKMRHELTEPANAPRAP